MVIKALHAIAMAILVTEVIREVMDFPTCSDRHRSWAQIYLARWIKWYSSTRYWSRWSLLWESRHLKSGKVSFFWGRKNIFLPSEKKIKIFLFIFSPDHGILSTKKVVPKKKNFPPNRNYFCTFFSVHTSELGFRWII